ncbi:GNAT family N-acetyltransferase [Stappia taiwanensis]|uniref:GNAT family N-acetyltransferase n=1 Tax=Stappia taiwanensis TaxID=992267 RepID=A0A838XKZ8_9HYPH|nr:GNAT family protein [Stappia taiwanensis]MBA4611195.1 GNAT family N-acetyltransferase [Stappia taiwanensis]GGE86701.1 N-acetyltransferase [Stappia taiwanensis]
MTQRVNALGQPIGPAVPEWTPRPRPDKAAMIGRTCRLEPFDAARHVSDLHAAYAADAEARNWTYLPYGPFASEAAFRDFAEATFTGEDPQFHVVVDQESGRALGVASFLRIDPANGVIEVGHINFAPALQRTVMASEAMFLMMVRVFDELGYRRYEWKCDALNAPSRAAAERLGFVYEGTFRQATIYRGRNRDTAWFSIIDTEWPALRRAFERWLDPANFDGDGRQYRSLAVLRAGAG